MQARDHASAVARGLPEDAQRFHLVLGIEMIRRFVEQVDVGRLGEHLGDRETATFSARQRQDVTVRQVADADRLERRMGQFIVAR